MPMRPLSPGPVGRVYAMAHGSAAPELSRLLHPVPLPARFIEALAVGGPLLAVLALQPAKGALRPNLDSPRGTLAACRAWPNADGTAKLRRIERLTTHPAPPLPLQTRHISGDRKNIPQAAYERSRKRKVRA